MQPIRPHSRASTPRPGRTLLVIAGDFTTAAKGPVELSARRDAGRPRRRIGRGRDHKDHQYSRARPRRPASTGVPPRIHGSKINRALKEAAAARRNLLAAMLDLLSLDPAVQSTDRRSAMAIGYVGLGALTFLNVAIGGGSRAVLTGMVLALAGLPWWFAFGGRRRLLGDALRGRGFAARGDRAGIWAT